MYRGKSNRWIHDIALLQLSEPLVLNLFIRPICLPFAHEMINYGERALVTGWGATQGKVNVFVKRSLVYRIDKVRAIFDICVKLKYLFNQMIDVD